MQELHEKYGEVVRVDPYWISYINPDGWKDIYGHRTKGRAENQKDQDFYQPELNGAHNIISTPDAKDHGRIRKIFSNAFSDKALKLQEGLIRDYVDKLISNIREATAKDPSVHLNFVKMFNCATFDIMGDLTFGEGLGMLEASEYTPWVTAVFDSVKMGAILRRINGEHHIIGALIELLMPKSLRELRQSHFDHTVERVDRRLEKDEKNTKPDIWSLVLNKGEEKLTVPEMHSNASIFMVAGTETTATLLSGLTYLLLKNPDKMKKVVAEVRALPYEDLSLDTLPRLPYLNACFEEGLRCYPPVPIGLPRVIPKGGSAICGEWVPEKVCLTILTIHIPR